MSTPDSEIAALQLEKAILKAQLAKVESLYLILAERHDALVRLQQITSKHLNPTPESHAKL